MSETYLDVADRIGARLCRDAMWWNGLCNWTGDRMEEDGSVYGALGPSLYNGASGVAWFLWRLAEATGEPIFRATAHAAIRQALARLPQPGCGLYAGGLGVVWAAAQIDGAVDEEAALAAATLDRALLDVVYGSAGAIAALLWMHRRSGGTRLIEAAVRHGELLLETAHRSDAEWSWKTSPAARNLTGFSHGAAGIGWALAELFAATRDGRFRDAALAAFRYERSCFDPAAGNWPDYRSDPPPFQTLWCHGAAGIGFSRLRAWKILGRADLMDEARVAVAATRDSLDAMPNFSLCHGAAGNADLMLYASEVLDEPEWRAEALAVADRGMERFERRRVAWPCGGPGGNESPDLMLGLAGIGYFYLRVAQTAANSTVLLVSD